MTKEEIKEVLSSQTQEILLRIDSRFSDYNEKLESKFSSFEDTLDERLSEHTKIILEAVNEKILASEQRVTAAFEAFTHDVSGMLSDVKDMNADATKLTEKVETTETILKTNVLPRLEVLEEKLVN